MISLTVIGFIARSRRLPELDRARFDAARAAWMQAALPSYDVTVEVTGRQAAVYSAQVRNGDTIAATRNGQPLKQKRTLRTWSVPGMFDTIESDVENIESVANGTARPGTPKLVLRARFHPDLNYPERYQRIQWGSSHEVTWRVVEFHAAHETPSPSH